MRGRVIAVLTAIVLAIGGAVLLTGYVSRADARALEGMEATSVLVVTAQIPEGTPAKDLETFVAEAKFPLMAVAQGAVSSLDELAGTVATVDLEPGEQVLTSRFADPSALIAQGEVAVPAGLQRVSILLDAERVVGGRLAAGDKVGVFVSLDEPKRTKLVQDKVLVIRVDGAIARAAEDAAVEGPVLDGEVMVTVAVNSPAAEEIVFGMEHGRVWLSLQPEDASTSGSRVVTDAVTEPQESVFE